MGNNRGAVIAVGLVLAIILGFPLVWRVQGSQMDGEFVEALRTGQVDTLPIGLQGKTWSEEELATAETLKLPGGFGRERALSRAIHKAGQYTISNIQYAYQGTVTDHSTGIKHLFGYQRQPPQGWRWHGIHPDSMELHIQQRTQQLEQMKQTGQAPAY